MRFLSAIDLGLLATQTSFALATFMPSLVRSPIRSDSATIAGTLKSSRPTGSVRSYTGQPRLRRTCPRELVGNCPGFRQRPGQAVELGHNQRVGASSNGHRRWPESDRVAAPQLAYLRSRLDR
jgi:hypothetical protein